MEPLKRIRRIRFPFICGGSVTGPRHGKMGVLCQDVSGWLQVPGAGRIPRAGIIIASDGVGSALEPRLGATTAVEAGLRATQDLFPVPVSQVLPALMKVAGSARDAVLSEALRSGVPVHDLSCTFMGVLFSRSYAASVHIGDGCVIRRGPGGELSLLSSPAGEYFNEVNSLTAGSWKSHTETRIEIAPTLGVAVMTDGCTRAACESRKGLLVPRNLFFDPLFSYVSSVCREKQASQEVLRFLAGPGMSKHSEDDKTLVVGITAT